MGTLYPVVADMVGVILAADLGLAAAAIAATVTVVMGVSQMLSQRGKNSSSSAKDLAEAGKLARADLVDEVVRLGAQSDRQDAQIRVLQDLVNSLGDSLASERARCTQVQTDLDRERRYTTRLAAALNAAGLDVPTKEGQ